MDRSPALCLENYDKLDLATFRTDLIKWQKWLSEDANKEWEKVVPNAHEVCVPCTDATQWPLQVMTLMTEERENDGGQQEEGSNYVNIEPQVCSNK